jgi:hypothetical protein
MDMETDVVGENIARDIYMELELVETTQGTSWLL